MTLIALHIVPQSVHTPMISFSEAGEHGLRKRNMHFHAWLLYLETIVILMVQVKCMNLILECLIEIINNALPYPQKK